MFKGGFEAYGRGRIRSLERRIANLDADIERLERKLRETPYEKQARRRRIRAKLARRHSKSEALSRQLTAWRRVLSDPLHGDADSE